MNDTSRKRPWWRLHGATWAAILLVLAAGAYLNLNVVDILYRLKYGPVRPSLAVEGWPVSAVHSDPVSSALSIDWHTVFADVAVCLAIIAGTGLQVERWRRQRRPRLRARWEHLFALVVLVCTAAAFEVVNRWGAVVDAVDYVVAFRWPALAALFFGLGLACLALVDSVGALAKHLARRLR